MRSLSSPFCIFVFLALFLVTGCSSNRTIVHDLTEPEANDISVFLAGKGIEATKVKAEPAGGAGGGQTEVLWDISVPETKAVEAMAILNANGFPRKKGKSLLTIFSEGSALVPSELQEKVRYQSGLSDQIASVIRKIDGVLDAEVQISFPKENLLNPNAPKEPVTASVYVKHNGVLDDPNLQLIPKIRRLVASSVPSLNYENVTVIPDRARYAEIPYSQVSRNVGEEKQYQSIWSIVVANESVTLFRVFFFSFLVLIFLLVLVVVWMIWKFHLLLTNAGGIHTLFGMHPLSLDQLQKTGETKEEPKTEGNEKKEEEPLGPDLAGAEGMGSQEKETKKTPPKNR